MVSPERVFPLGKALVRNSKERTFATLGLAWRVAKLVAAPQRLAQPGLWDNVTAEKKRVAWLVGQQSDASNATAKLGYEVFLRHGRNTISELEVAHGQDGSFTINIHSKTNDESWGIGGNSAFGFVRSEYAF